MASPASQDQSLAATQTLKSLDPVADWWHPGKCGIGGAVGASVRLCDYGDDGAGQAALSPLRPSGSGHPPNPSYY